VNHPFQLDESARHGWAQAGSGRSDSQLEIGSRLKFRPVRDLEKVLVVDDDEHVLGAIQRSLHNRFDLSMACGALEGLDVFDEKGPFALVISDMCMPGMDGREFLALIHERDRDAIGIMLTGQQEMEPAVAAAGRGSIFRMLAKPCGTDDLVAVIEAGIEQRRLLQSRAELMETRLRLAQRMKLLERCAAGVMHDMRNILTVMTLQCGLAMEESADGRKVDAHLDRISAAASEAARISRRMNVIGRPNVEGHFAPLQVEFFLAELGTVLQSRVPRNIEIVVESGENLPLIRADAGLLGLALLNLVLRCSDAIAGCGSIVLNASCATLHNEENSRGGAARSGQHVCIRVSDSDAGADEAGKRRSFEADLAMKPGGNGPGLSLVADIVRRHDGALASFGTKNQGMTVEIHIPVSA